MKRIIIIVIAACVIACKGKKEEAYLAVNHAAPPCFAPDKIHFCPDQTNTFCPQLPNSVFNINSEDGNFMNGYTSVLSPEFQPSFDMFSWQSFVALNWPADAGGAPVGSFTDTPGALRVWEHYTDVNSIFESNTEALRAAADKANGDSARFFYLDSKAPNVASGASDFLEADGHPIIDRNGNFAVFEQRINPEEEAFITGNGLTTKAGIKAYYDANDRSFQMPISSDSTPGAMEIKATWRILDTARGDDLSRYYHQKSIIYVSADNSATGKAFTVEATLGLVGIHIIRKISQFDEWIWSTFEHIDNVPDNVQQAQTDQETQWSFYNPDCLNCKPNTPPTHVAGDTVNGKVMYRWSDSAPYASRYLQSVPGEKGSDFGTQVMRTYPIYFCTEQVNEVWRAKLMEMNSVFANYRLIGSQWNKVDGPYTAPDAPFFLGNTVAETYFQKTSSCIECHRGARVIYQNDTIKTDFSFIFNGAR
ncbi:hypothetical protein [Ascidiimonas aurantiaca]|uniref:hypothetical protein n=1 Tax=Ascidiimonas aurantiaca TaxID=1685432 RepID=UPI0030EF89B8